MERASWSRWALSGVDVQASTGTRQESQSFPSRDSSPYKNAGKRSDSGMTITSRLRPVGAYLIELSTESATIERCQVRIPLRFLAANSFQFAFEQSR